MIKHTIILPPFLLQSHVQYFWTLKVDRPINDTNPIRTFVDDSSGIIIEFGLDKKEVFLRRSMLYGQTTKPTGNRNNNSFLALGVLFHPFALNEIFGWNANELTNQRIDLNEFLNYPLTDIISEACCSEKQILILSELLTVKLSSLKKQDTLVKQCIQYIKARQGVLTVKELLVQYNLTEKQLERKFRAVIGVTPRHYIKITSFKEALSLITKNKYAKLSDVAYQLRYFDQAHFIKNVKELSGLSPKLLRSYLKTGVVNIIL